MGKKSFGGKRKNNSKGTGGRGERSSKKKRRLIEEKVEAAYARSSGPAPKKALQEPTPAIQLGGPQVMVDEKQDCPIAPRPVKPGFDKLLEALGVAESESDDNADEEDESEEEPMAANVENEAAVAGAKDGAEEELEEEEEEELEVEPANGQRTEAPAPMGSTEATKVKVDCPSYYEHFWADPPVSLVLGRLTKPAEGPRPAVPQSFSLPGLSRCEAHHCDVAGLRGLLCPSADAAATWQRCALFPRLHLLFEQFLAKEGLEIGSQEGAFFLFLHCYVDVAFPHHSHLTARGVRALYMLHVADHLQKAAQQKQQNNAAIRAARERIAAGGEDADAAKGFTIADSGFSKPRVLVLCPFRSTCYELVKIFLALCPKKQVGNKHRFEEEFGQQGDEDSRRAETKPAEWRHLFDGNNDDRFVLGVSLRRKLLKLYTPLADSDVLFCSPLGLRQKTGVEGEWRRDYDFLSSIEVCILDRADVLRMQNWEHVQEVLQVLNRKPQSLDGVDISRLRPAYAEDRGRAFRQTIVTSDGQNMDFDAVFSKATSGATAAEQPLMGSLAKKLKAGGGRGGRRGRWSLALDDDDPEEEDLEEGVSMSVQAKAEVTVQRCSQSCRGCVRLAEPHAGGPMQRGTTLGIARQFFLHTPCGPLQEQNDQLFKTFLEKYWKPLGSSLERLLIVANTYFNYLRLRQYLRTEDASFCSTFEYSGKKALQRTRERFNAGEKRVLLVTERLLWYRRYKMRGADFVLFYGPPETPGIYEDTLAAVRTPSTCNSMCLFTKHDGFALERIVGHERACRMLTSPPGKVFVFS